MEAANFVEVRCGNGHHIAAYLLNWPLSQRSESRLEGEGP